MTATHYVTINTSSSSGINYVYRALKFDAETNDFIVVGPPEKDAFWNEGDEARTLQRFLNAVSERSKASEMKIREIYPGSILASLQDRVQELQEAFIMAPPKAPSVGEELEKKIGEEYAKKKRKRIAEEEEAQAEEFAKRVEEEKRKRIAEEEEAQTEEFEVDKRPPMDRSMDQICGLIKDNYKTHAENIKKKRIDEKE